MNGPLPLIDLIASRAERDESLERVAANNQDFITQSLDLIKQLPFGWTGTGEDISQLTADAGLIPLHPNAYGALTKTALTRRLIRKTGQWVPMRKRTSHARCTPKYVRN